MTVFSLLPITPEAALSQEQVTLPAPEASMFLTIALALFVIWVLCLLVFKVTAGAIHLLVAIAVIAFIVHFIRGRKTPTP
jgi:Flp pilus assembly protein TadB